jgi:hypothetical protein
VPPAVAVEHSRPLFDELPTAVGFRLEMDCGDDVMQRGVEAVFGREVGAADARIVTEPKVVT